MVTQVGHAKEGLLVVLIRPSEVSGYPLSEPLRIASGDVSDMVMKVGGQVSYILEHTLAVPEIPSSNHLSGHLLTIFPSLFALLRKLAPQSGASSVFKCGCPLGASVCRLLQVSSFR